MALENKAWFMVGVELDDKWNSPQHMRLDSIEYAKGATLANRVTTAMDADVNLITDGLASFNATGTAVAQHGAIIVSPRRSGDLTVF